MRRNYRRELKEGVVITQENISLYYEYMGAKEIEENSEVLEIFFDQAISNVRQAIKYYEAVQVRQMRERRMREGDNNN